ncbi:MAG: hypothetical protein ACFFB3_21550 [Candidatus Hodarchaeota archaeon]
MVFMSKYFFRPNKYVFFADYEFLLLGVGRMPLPSGGRNAVPSAGAYFQQCVWIWHLYESEEGMKNIPAGLLNVIHF